MGTFTITQTPNAVNLYLIPNADGCNIDFSPYGETNNYECVDDPLLAVDDDATYVSNVSPTTAYDLYTLPDHTTETGTINYVQIFAVGKSHIHSQHADGVYKIIWTDNACSNIYKSGDIDLTNAYGKYEAVWTENERTAAAWIWTDIDNLQIGVENSSPSLTLASHTLTLRPNGAGNSTNLAKYPSFRQNYACVDETSHNGDSDYVYQLAIATNQDTYATQNHTTETGPITKVVVFAVARTTGDHGALDPDLRIIMRSGGTDYYSSIDKLTQTYTYYSYEWTVNPADAGAWEWSDIDNMEIGVEIHKYSGGSQGRVTQVYAVVYYDETVNPEIRTTQVYGKINYTPGSTTCVLQKPTEVSVDESQNIKMLNFWSGNRAVYGEYRGSKTLVATGIQYSDDACTIMECIKTMGEDGSQVSLSGLGDLFDKDFRIASFGYTKVSDKPLNYKWILECEFSE